MTALFAALLFTMASAPDTAAGGTSADPGTAVIAVAIPEGQNSVMQEALNRLRGEALSVGFEVRFVHTNSPNPPAAQLEALAPGPRTAAVVVFADQPKAEDAEIGPPQLDVWFLDRSSGKTSVAHLQVSDEDMDRADVVIAVRAVDFIRARMFDTLAYRLATAPKPTPPAEPIPAIRDRTFLAAGLAVLATSSGFAPSLLPYIEAGYQLRSWVRVTASAFGLGTRPEQHAQEGSVRIDQRYIGLGLTFTRWQWRRFLPHAELGAGAYWVVAEGRVNPDFQGQGHRITAWSVGGRACVGITASLSRHFFLDVTAGTLWLMPEPRLYSSETFVASTGLPSWTGTALVGARF